MRDSNASDEVSSAVSLPAAGRSYFIVGGAGFIGSHFTERLLRDNRTRRVTVFDNFSSGREWHLQEHLAEHGDRFHLVRGNVQDLDELSTSMYAHDIVIHLASNPDIARAAKNPDIDFHHGTALTNNVVEAMRRAGVLRLLYASGSGVYGETHGTLLKETYSPLRPISTYGASKLAGEALIASYCAMFGMSACAFRFGNVVGARQTHGVGFDFIRRLKEDPTRLRILGNGAQSKTYIHVSDVVEAVLLACDEVKQTYEVFNVATNETVTVTEIAEMAVEALGLEQHPCFIYTGGDRGWKGDVPIVRLDTARIQALGWKPVLNCRDAVQRSLFELVADERVLVS